ncbi:YihY/virulence factor BrkB family protein [Actinotalea ferrariae]|uniref:YihY/virulence factor BrkB family protein n=1 Tax=Actinotalea ferrariae TaxID=1386098 RepID=UPI001C8B0C67|nr:YihY/virulence factor BrkB family protein [Actinotalea ferrariae]MBX9245670.1 YihY/virulence factor BrkB family protein [Actinotalea ferrariae]
MAKTLEKRHPGAHASTPTRIPARGWWQVVLRAVQRSGQDRVPLVGAGVAFFAFLSLFPALIAAVLVYGLVSDPADITAHVTQLSEVLPDEATALVTDQLHALASDDDGRLSIGLAISLGVALFSASTGVVNLVTAVNLAYEEQQRTGLVRRRLEALAFTAGAIVTLALLLALLAVVPLTVTAEGVPGWLVDVGRWLGVGVVSALALAALYRYAPERRDPRLPWVSVGAVVATAIWILASAGFSLYVTYAAGYARTYGTLAGVVVLLVWLWLTSMAVLLGAEINAEAEHQTDADTTVGPERPRGDRDAVKADTAVGRPDPEHSPEPGTHGAHEAPRTRR